MGSVDILKRLFWPIATIVSISGIHLALLNNNILLNYYSSDNFYVLNFLDSLRSGTIGSFHFSHLPTVFPEHLVIIPLVLIHVPWQWAFLIFSCLGVLIFFASGHIILRELGVGAAGQTLFVALFAGLAVALDLVHLQFIVIGVHGGSFTLSFVMAVIAHRRLQRAWTIPALFVWNATVGMAVFSDALFLWEFVAPFLFTLAVMATLGRLPWRSALLLGGTSAVSGALGLGLLHLLPISPFPPASLALMLEQTRKFITTLDPVIGAELLLPLAVALICYMARFWFGAAAVSSVQDRKIADAEIFFWHFGIAAALLTLALTMQAFENVGTYRYTTCALWWPPLLCIAAGRHHIDRFSRWIASGAVLTIVMCGLSALVFPAKPVFYEEMAMCLDQAKKDYPLLAGLGDYWASHPATLYTKGRVVMSQVNADGDPLMWLNNRTDYYTDKTMATVRDYNFILMRNINYDSVKARYGEPDGEIRCIEDRVLYYRDSKRITDHIAQWLAQHPKD